jgi:UDP-glucose 4-epimerase
MRSIGRGSRVLVTGGAGFVGAGLVRRLAAEGYVVRVLDDLSRGRRDRLVGVDVELMIGDVRAERSVREACSEVAAVVHLAELEPGLSSRDERLAHEVNVTGTLNLLAAALRARVGRFVLGSSAAVYGTRASYLLHEEAAPHAVTAAGTQKAAAEAYAHLFHERDGLPTCVARLFTVYGDARDGGVVARFVAAARGSESLTIHGDGTQTRDLIHVDDVVQALLGMLTTPGAVGRIFNVASGESVSVRHVASLVSELAGGLPPPRYVPARPGEPHDVHASVAAASATLGFRARVKLREGIAECLGLSAPRRVMASSRARPARFPEGSGTKLTAAKSAPLFAERPASWIVAEESDISFELDVDDEVILSPRGLQP